ASLGVLASMYDARWGDRQTEATTEHRRGRARARPHAPAVQKQVLAAVSASGTGSMGRARHPRMTGRAPRRSALYAGGAPVPRQAPTTKKPSVSVEAGRRAV